MEVISRILGLPPGFYPASSEGGTGGAPQTDERGRRGTRLGCEFASAHSTVPAGAVSATSTHLQTGALGRPAYAGISCKMRVFTRIAHLVSSAGLEVGL